MCKKKQKKNRKKKRKTNAVCDTQFQVICDPIKTSVLKFVKIYKKQEDSNAVHLTHVDDEVQHATLNDDSIGISTKLTESMEANVSEYLKANANNSAFSRSLKNLSGDLNLSN